MKTKLLELRNKLYNSLPTGQINAFDLTVVIANHLKELDALIDSSPSSDEPLSQLEQDRELYRKAKNIFNSNLDWEEKFDLIFSKEISQKVQFDLCDPDTTYEEDVTAFMNAFDDYMEHKEEVEKLLAK